MKIAELLQQLLSRGIAGNQKQLVKAFADIGVITTQSSVSRALKKINAVKSVDDSGNSIYTLQTSVQVQQEASPPFDIFESLVHRIDHNGHLIVVHTKPGMAMTVAKFIDDKKFGQIMGTTAGDDTIMIAPKNVSLTHILADHVKVYLSSIGIME
jgi:transcriptional regulator of arginine metabolism